MGYMPDYQQINPQKIIYGRFINDVDMAQKRKVCVIGTQIAERPVPGNGQDPTGKVIKVNNSLFSPSSASCGAQSTAMSFSNVERTVVAPVSRSRSRCTAAATRIHMLAIAGREDTPSKEVEKACLQVGDLRQAT